MTRPVRARDICSFVRIVIGMNMDIEIKRVYEPASKDDGYRVLVDRLWPRGMKKEEVEFDLWLREVAPSNSLRKWYGHDPERWEEFKTRYARELEDKKELVEQIESKAKDERVTLLFSSKEEHNNNAQALKEYIERS